MNKDTKKFYSRKICKLSHNHPLTIFNEMITIFTKDNFDNLIPTAINCLNYCTSLSLDIMNFLLIKQIADNKKPVLNR